MNVKQTIFCAVLFSMTVLLAACSSDKAEKTEPSGASLTQEESDSLAIQATLTEIITRWRYGDKSALYEQEFDYFRFENTYDEYLEFDQVKKMNADSAWAINVKGVNYFDRDSAAVDVEVIFRGPTGNLSYDYDTYKMYFNDNRWVRPSFSVPQFQKEFEEARRIADSAAAADEDLEY